MPTCILDFVYCTLCTHTVDVWQKCLVLIPISLSIILPTVYYTFDQLTTWKTRGSQISGCHSASSQEDCNSREFLNAMLGRGLGVKATVFKLCIPRPLQIDMKSTSQSQWKGVYIIVSIQVYKRVLHNFQAKKTIWTIQKLYDLLAFMVKMINLIYNKYNKYKTFMNFNNDVQKWNRKHRELWSLAV